MPTLQTRGFNLTTGTAPAPAEQIERIYSHDTFIVFLIAFHIKINLYCL